MNYLDQSVFKSLISHINGFTLIELLIVIAITTIIAGASTPFISRFVLVNAHDTALTQITSTLRKAQVNAMQGKANETWGVCLQASTLRLFSSSCNAPVYSEEYAIPNTITITGLNTVTFNLRGEPSNSGIATVSSSVQTNTVTLNEAGALSVE